MSEFTILTERVERATIEEALIHWNQYHDKVGRSTFEQAFFDFIDPVRQTDISDYESMSWVYLTPTAARRIEFMAGPHWYTYFKANADRVEHAHITWGKKPRYHWHRQRK